MGKAKRILFVVSEQHLQKEAHLIKTTLWAIESDIEYEILSVGAFIDRYGAMSIPEAIEQMDAYNGICNMGVLSKREEKAYRELMNPCVEYAKSMIHNKPTESRATMKVQSVTVEIHEKRNHPHGEYSHFDSRVSYTADIYEGESPGTVVANLQFIARQQVADECDRWVADIERKRQVDEAKSGLVWIIDLASSNQLHERNAEDFEKHLQSFSADEQAEYRSKFDKAKEEFWQRTRKSLDGLVDKAERNNFGAWDNERFDSIMLDLPESEHQGYRDRLKAALAPKVEAKEPAKEGDVPF